MSSLTLPKLREDCACGRQAKLVERMLIMCVGTNKTKKSYSVECSCGIHTEAYATKTGAIRAWNAGFVRSAPVMVV